METYVVTGGAGFIGSHIVEELVSKGHKVIVIDSLFDGKEENLKNVMKKITFIKDDIRNFDMLKKAFKGVDYVIHQAARRSVPNSLKAPHEYNEVNIDGTLNILEAAKECKVKRVVFASSSSVYGDVKEFPQKESVKPDPLSPYAITKLAGEQYLRSYYLLYGLETVSLRYFNVFGPRQDPKSQYAAVIPLFIEAIKSNKSPDIFGDGEQSRDFTYVKDVVKANLLACKAKGAAGEAFNIANGEGVSVNYIAKKINEILGKDIKSNHLPPRKGDVRKTLADPSKAKKILGYTGDYTFDKGLKLTIDAF